MKLVVFGATGGTGKCLVDKGLAAGHEIIAAARRPDAVSASHAKLRVVKCDVTQAAEVAAAVAGADAVLSAIGPANNKKPGTLISQGVANMIAGCTAHGVKRIVFESGLMVGDGAGLGAFSRLGVGLFRWLNSALTADKRLAEQALAASPLEYVIVRPPNLDDRERGGLKTGVDTPINAAKKIGHADVAAFMIDAAGSAGLARTIQTIGR